MLAGSVFNVIADAISLQTVLFKAVANTGSGLTTTLAAIFGPTQPTADVARTT